MPDRLLPFVSNETLLRITFVLITAFAVRWLILFFINKGVNLLQKLDIRNREEISGRAKALGHIASSIVTILVLLTASILILHILKFDVTAILASAGILGIVVGFATQALLKDIIAGISLLVDGQYHLGDIVEIQGIRGAVKKMGLRSTVIKDFGDVIHVIPNSEIKGIAIIPYAFAEAEVYVSYEESIDKLSEILERELKSYKATFFSEPPRFLGIDEFRETGMKISVGGRTSPKNQAIASTDLRRWLKRILEKEKIRLVQLSKG